MRLGFIQLRIIGRGCGVLTVVELSFFGGVDEIGGNKILLQYYAVQIRILLSGTSVVVSGRPPPRCNGETGVRSQEKLWDNKAGFKGYLGGI